MTQPTIKASFSIQDQWWQQLINAPNRSAVVNQALELYFGKQGHLEQAENHYWQNVENNLAHGIGTYESLNPEGEALTPELLESNLWS